jgi:hypothetical protein
LGALCCNLYFLQIGGWRGHCFALGMWCRTVRPALQKASSADRALATYGNPGSALNRSLGSAAGQPNTAGQLEEALDDGVVEKLSSTLNMLPDEIFGFLAKHLPTVIDALNPMESFSNVEHFS